MRRLRSSSTDAGFALVEAITACALAAVAVAGIATMMAATSKANQTSRSTSGAVAFARERIEDARSLGYDELVHMTGAHASDPAVVAGEFDPDGTGALVAEDVIYASDGISSMEDTLTRDGITLTAKTYVTDSPTEAKRVTVVVTWTQAGTERSTSLSSLIAPPASPLSAAADAFGGQDSVGVVTPLVSSRARRGGGLDENTAATSTPLTGWSVTGATTSAEVDPAVQHTAIVEISSASISQDAGGSDVITIVASGLSMTLQATAGGTTTSTVTGTVTVNGVQYVNPSPGTEVTIGTWTIALNSEMSGADGSSSVSFIRLIGPDGEDLRLGWAWVSAVTPW